MNERKNKIYFIAPSGVSTGGPEAIHRLCKFLIDELKLDVRILYTPTEMKQPVHPNFSKYNIPIATTIDDESNNLIVLPDYYPHLLLGKELKKIKIWIWWLSVDFFYKSYHESNIPKFLLLVRRYWSALQRRMSLKFPFLVGSKDDFSKTMIKHCKLKIDKINPISKCSRHLCQSYYALDYFKGMGLQNVSFLGDFTDKSILAASFAKKDKKNIVLYSPAKGFNFTNKIINEGIGITFIPLSGLTRIELTNLLKVAKVYIDFGNHPGRDRIPREAAMYGCCILTSLRGSAKYQEDIPIPSQYKFIDAIENLPAIIRKINDIFTNYTHHINDFEMYRSFILEQDRLAYINAKDEFSGL